MTPLEKLNACAARLIQIAGSARGRDEIQIKEIASTIRGAAASIRTALEATPSRPRHAKFGLIVGDEGPHPNADSLE